MITRTIPLISPFPDVSIIERISSGYLSLASFRPLFYDIETTGLSASSSYCYLIGCITYEAPKWILRQWLAESPEDEADILKCFSDFACNFTYTIHYNGRKFDEPYLAARASLHHLDMPVLTLPSMDLYPLLKPCKAILKLTRMKQPDLETFLSLPARIFADGRVCIKCYKEYVKKADSEALNEVFGHNLEDLCGLGSVFEMLTYLQLFSEEYEVIQTQLPDSDHLLITLKVPFPFPAAFSYGDSSIYITGTGHHIKLLIAAVHGKWKMYYPNYKDYAYLPAEDTAIPKTLSSYIDKSLKRPARPETCYTWFSPNEAFLNNTELQKKYVKNLLAFFLNYHI